MNVNNDFALVPRAPGWLEKTEPGAKRILSGMVADTLALAKKGPLSKRDIHVLMAGSPEFNECFSFVVSEADDRLKAHFDFHFHSCQRMDELAAALKQGKFDLALVQLHNTPPVEHQFTDKREVLLRVERLLAEKNYIVWAGLEVASFLRSVHGIPVVMVSDTGGEEAEKLLAAQVGAHALFPWVGMDIQAFCDCLRGILKDADKPAKTRPLRIVVVDDEQIVTEAMKLVLGLEYNDAEILTFTDGEGALQELTRKDPDLFTTDWIHLPGRLYGDGLLRILASRGVKYPIFVISACAAALEKENALRNCVDTGLNISLLPKPFALEQLRSLLSKHLGPGDGLELRKDAP